MKRFDIRLNLRVKIFSIFFFVNIIFVAIHERFHLAIYSFIDLIFQFFVSLECV